MLPLSRGATDDRWDLVWKREIDPDKEITERVPMYVRFLKVYQKFGRWCLRRDVSSIATVVVVVLMLMVLVYPFPSSSLLLRFLQWFIQKINASRINHHTICETATPRSSTGFVLLHSLSHAQHTTSARRQLRFEGVRCWFSIQVSLTANQWSLT